MIEVIPFDKKYTTDFKRLNLEWLQTFFTVEPYDEFQLSNPVIEIIDKGGYIFLAKEGVHITGTVALMKEATGSYELTKMSVTGSSQGKGISKLLMEKCIVLARQQRWQRLFLYSSTLLVPAINLYRKYGFREIPLERSSQYRRTNIKMELQFNTTDGVIN